MLEPSSRHLVECNQCVEQVFLPFPYFRRLFFLQKRHSSHLEVLVYPLSFPRDSESKKKVGKKFATAGHSEELFFYIAM